MSEVVWEYRVRSDGHPNNMQTDSGWYPEEEMARSIADSWRQKGWRNPRLERRRPAGEPEAVAAEGARP
jgi:hypothetical protein